MSRGFKEGYQAFGSVKNMSEALKEIQNAESEFLRTEDPIASLGVLYVLLYLKKYNKLPPEVEIWPRSARS